MSGPLSPGAQPLPAPPPPPVRDEPRDATPAISLTSILVLGFVALVLAAVLLPSLAHPHGRRAGRIAHDANNLKQLWTMQANYMATFGGREKLMPPDTGSDFWTRLAKTSPPIIDSSIGDIYDCPISPGVGGIDNCEYRGPASDVNAYGDGDPVGADVDGNHGAGEGGIVIRRSGDAMEYAAADPVWAAAAVKTR